jgi:ELWxxDGT repeat protein
MRNLFVLILSMCSIVSSAQISILKNDNGDALRYSFMTYMAHTDSFIYFNAGNSGTSISGELHKSDGTVDGTALVKAFNEGSGQFGIGNSFNFYRTLGDELLFNSFKTGEGFTLRKLKFENDSIETITEAPSSRASEVYCNSEICFFTQLDNGLITFKSYDGTAVSELPLISAASFTDVSLAHVKGNNLFFSAVDITGDWKIYRYQIAEQILVALEGYYPAQKQRPVLLQIEIIGDDALAMINFQTVGKEIVLIDLEINEITSLVSNPVPGTELFGQSLQNHIFQFDNTIFAWLPVGSEELSLVEFNPLNKNFSELNSLKRPSPFNQMFGPLVHKYDDKLYFVARLEESESNELIQWLPQSNQFNSLLKIDADINYGNEIHDGLFFQSVANLNINYIHFFDLNSQVDVKYYLEEPCPSITLRNPFFSTSPNKYITISSCPGNGVTFFTLEISGTNSIGYVHSPIAAWEVYPNPVNDLVFIRSKNPQDLQTCEWSVLDMNGRIMRSGRLNGLDSTLDLSNLCSGLYILTLKYNSFLETHRIIKK